MGLPGTAVAAAFAGAWLGFCGAAVGAAELVVLATGVDVAEDPQANSRATNSRTTALGRYLLICELDRDFGMLRYLLLDFKALILEVLHIYFAVYRCHIYTAGSVL